MEPYVSPYTVDDRTRNSVMAAQVGNKSIREVHDRESRRSKISKFKPRFDGDSFSGTLGTITTVIECVCFTGAEGWDDVQKLVPKTGRVLGGSFRTNVPQGYWGHDRATLSLYGPLENLEEMLKAFLGKVEAWANKPKYFKEVTRPFIIRTLENSISESSTAKKLREELEFVGPIHNHYVNSFDSFSHSMQDPILELRALGEFIASILKGGDEIVTVETNASTLPTSSQYFSTILNPEPATQEHLDTETAVGQHGGGSSGFEELLEAAGYGSGLSKSLSPIREAKRELSVLEDAGSPSYSPLSSPSFSVDTLVKPFSVSSMRPGEPSSDVSSSILLKPSSLYDTKASTAPRGTPQWKIDLSERKGHRIEILHVGSRELDTLAKCLTLVHSATEKGEECMRAIIDRKDLAAEMQPEYEQWEECCADLENNVRIDEREAREHMKEDRAKGSAIYGAEAFGPDAYEGDDWFGTADSRDYGRLDPNDAQDTWGYRKVDAPSFTAKASRRRRDGSATYTYTDPDETEDEYEQGYKHRGAPRDFGMGSTFPAERGFGTGSPMSVGSHRSSGTEGVEEVRNFEEAFEEGGGGDGLDQEMMDVGEGEGDGEDLKQGKIIAKEEEEEGGDGDGKEGGNGKKGLTSGGGRTIGLYGELL